MKIKFVVPTRHSALEFQKQSLTGRFLTNTNILIPIEVRLFPENKVGLSSLYNTVIEESIDDPAILVFAHDDIMITDDLWSLRILSSLDEFDMVGVIGNQRRLPNQPAWYFVNNKFQTDDRKYFSGSIRHGNDFLSSTLMSYGNIRQKVKLLDGVFLAAHSTTFIKHNIRFDPQFDFHLYDVDICRQFENKKLSCGTCDLTIVHQSSGNYNTISWHKSSQQYFEKWGS